MLGLSLSSKEWIGLHFAGQDGWYSGLLIEEHEGLFRENWDMGL